MGYVRSSRLLLDEKEYNKISARIAAIGEGEESEYAHSRVFLCERGEDNGFAPQSLDVLEHTINAPR